ncbi:MAG: hypothetical protein PUA81_06455, partial [Oscillospiraceae bacterium]|nr:hypothetical protein [Oscillospiraceae bacterium]
MDLTLGDTSKNRERSGRNLLIIPSAVRQVSGNLDYYKNEEDEEKDDENPPKRFSFLTKEDANNGNYYKVKNILAFDDDRALLRELIKAGYEEIIQNDLCRLFSRIHSSGSDGIVHYYCISENTYDEAL